MGRVLKVLRWCGAFARDQLIEQTLEHYGLKTVVGWVLSALGITTITALLEPSGVPLLIMAAVLFLLLLFAANRALAFVTTKTPTVEPPLATADLAAWNVVDPLTIWQAARLWAGEWPKLPMEYDKASYAPFRALKNAAKAGKLTINRAAPLSNSEVCQAEVRRLAESLGQRPAFFFPAEEKKNAETERILAARVRLVELRDEGVAHRNKGVSTRLVGTEGWNAKAEEWEENAHAAIAAIDKADAGWFRTLDMVPAPRLPVHISDPSGAATYRQHDFRLVKLEELIKKYGRLTQA
jgi:hypothetical protein